MLCVFCTLSSVFLRNAPIALADAVRFLGLVSLSALTADRPAERLTIGFLITS